jgi:hypothetical protein
MKVTERKLGKGYKFLLAQKAEYMAFILICFPRDEE